MHYARVPRLFADLELAHGDGRFARLFRTLVKADLLILDDWGPDRLSANQRRDLMEIVEDRYGRGSTLITSQLPTDTWHDVIGEPTFADAILDRIVHNAYRLALDGPSMRKIQVGEAETAVPVADTTSSASTTSTKPAKGAKQSPPHSASRPPPWVNRSLLRAPLRQTRGGHSATRAGPSD